MTGTAIILGIFYWFADPILVAIWQNKEVAAAGALFSRGLIPQLFAFAVNAPMQRFLQAQNIVAPLAYISVATFFLHILITWVGVDKLEFGLLGTALKLDTQPVLVVSGDCYSLIYIVQPILQQYLNWLQPRGLQGTVVLLQVNSSLCLYANVRPFRQTSCRWSI